MREGRDFIVYAVKDELTGLFLQPIFIQSEGEALRVFEHMINTNGIWKDNPGQFNLYKLGTFNEKTGLGDYNDPEMIQGGTAVVERR